MNQQQQPLLEVKNLTREFPAGESTVQILKGVDLAIYPGELVAIVGQSGSGKSTLMNIIGLLDRQTSGFYELNGVDISKLKDSELSTYRSKKIGFVFQNFNLFPHKKVIENVMLAPLLLHKDSKDQLKEKALYLLEKVGLKDKADSYPNQLSGGQKQRVAIARALAMEPDVMLFDEPTSALDPEVVGDVLKVMRQLANEGMTMVIVTHEMNFAREVADWIWLMEAGQIIEKARPGAFFDAPQHPSARRFVQSHLGRARTSPSTENDVNDPQR